MFEDIFELLSHCLDEKITEIIMSIQEPQQVIEHISSLYWLGQQKAINGITSKRAADQLLHYMQSREYENTRMNFILNTTARLKLHLGEERWDQLINELSSSLAVTDARLNEDEIKEFSLLSLSSRKETKINVRVFHANNWMVTVALYGLNPETSNHISRRIIAYQDTLSSVREKISSRGSRERILDYVESRGE